MPQSVEINRASIKTFVLQSEFVEQLDLKIACLDAGTVEDAEEYSEDPKDWEAEVVRLQLCGINSIAELQSELANRQKLILDFAARWLSGEREGRTFAYGVSLLYLTYVLMGEIGDRDRIMQFIQASSFSKDKWGWEQLADNILETYRSITSLESR